MSRIGVVAEREKIMFEAQDKLEKLERALMSGNDGGISESGLLISP